MAGCQGHERVPGPGTVQGIGGIGSPSGSSVVSNLTGESASTPLYGDATAVTDNASATATVTKSASSAVADSSIAATSKTSDALGSEIVNLELEDVEGGDSGDSDVEGEEVEFHDETVKNSETDFDVEDSTEAEDEGDLKAMLKSTSTGGTEQTGELAEDGSHGINSLKNNVRIPKPDPEWKCPPVRTERGEPPFESVDNPGGWNRYYFQPKFMKGKDGKYAGHFLPTGATPVPIGPSGKRKCGPWEFHYNGFKNASMPYCRGATTTNLFPKEMMGHLDANILSKLGLTKERVQDVDALFFFQLLLPFCDPMKSGIADDPRIGYYTEVEKFTNASELDDFIMKYYRQNQFLFTQAFVVDL
eukprot:CAMPEP_0195249198 /NCGR_PEP_ID=MMETSP0706-20130129/1978_1 /TAXON_ID=33640 /ORGANISM="Asterionellopsis glacialis, Strain CCMP134" /LENGTH=359 /DNA_ID=CAMNT_0040300965 /DNA_START=20 /DNA_END=1102 /DNA_ORIENTATION=+